jgi:hypothetical protein
VYGKYGSYSGAFTVELVRRPGVNLRKNVLPTSDYSEYEFVGVL